MCCSVKVCMPVAADWLTVVVHSCLPHLPHPSLQSFPNESSIQQKVLGLLVSLLLFYSPFSKQDIDSINNLQTSLFLFTFGCVEQHSGGRRAAWGTDGAGVFEPHQHSAAQPRGGGQLLRRWHPCTSDIKRRRGLDTEPWSSMVTAGATGRNKYHAYKYI